MKLPPVWLVALKNTSGHWVLSMDAAGRYPSRHRARKAMKKAKENCSYKYRVIKFVPEIWK